ncbi:MAG: SIS domain-containing protein [Pseudomonadales bacterium]|nr:SIS domain-containing protein [Candidatus Woesebacteria bacterium]MCB9800600.1 SIS domain-containing protein [Pseudomonadales bacterium]
MPDSIIDSREKIGELDKSNMIGSIEALGKQIEHAWEELKNISFTPKDEIRNIVVSGMGGSALGADVIAHLFKEELKVPLYINRTYSLPEFVDMHTLVVLSSYSGTTEEVIAAAAEAEARKAQIMVICAGGTLLELAQNKGYAHYKIDPVHNASDQPRMAIGYSVFGTIGLFEKAGLLQISDADVVEVVKTINKQVEACTIEVSGESNPAKALAYTMLDRQPVIIVADFLEGAAHVSANQHNENGKAYVNYKVIPEINHHLMEGLRFPKSNASTQVFIFVNSVLYPPKISLRMRLTQQIVEDNHIETMAVPLQASSKMAQAFEMISLFSFCSFYLAMLEGIDPSPIPFVDAFKEELKKQGKDYE